MNQMDNFRYIIAEERKRAGLTQEALATRIGITPQAVSKWENGVGYPDVTLFPVIANVLNIPISRLFGEEEKRPSRVGTLPDTYGGLAFVMATGECVCYASKEIGMKDEESGLVQFKDGSEANLNTATVTNRGAGEIRIYKIAELMPDIVWEDACVPVDFDHVYECIRSYRLSVDLGCAVMVTSDGEEGKCRVTAKGDTRFLAAIAAVCEGDTLCIEIKAKNDHNGSNAVGDNVLHIHTGQERGRLFLATINGAGEVAIAPDFDRLELTVNGCGDITAASADETLLKINGSGNIEMRESLVSTDIKINGSGDIRLDRAASPTLKINGSGDIDCGSVSGEMSATVNGSGDITCDGDLTRLILSINGAGDFHGEELTATDAEIKALQSTAEITIAQIRGTSVEKLGKKCKLSVGRRGV